MPVEGATRAPVTEEMGERFINLNIKDIADSPFTV
jgi:hypothetical protein